MAVTLAEGSGQQQMVVAREKGLQVIEAAELGGKVQGRVP